MTYFWGGARPDLRPEEQEQHERKAEGLDLDPGVGHFSPDMVRQTTSFAHVATAPRSKAARRRVRIIQPSCAWEELAHHPGKVGPPLQEPDPEDGGEDAVDDRGLHLEEPLVVEPDGEPAEHHDQHGGEDLHPADPPGEPPEHRDGREQDRHEGRGRDDEAVVVGAADDV
jgi:hypothetical protein